MTATVVSLHESNNNGELSKFLGAEYEKCGGCCSAPNPRIDSEIKLMFRKEKLPEVGSVAEAITKHYLDMGFTVAPCKLRKNPSGIRLIVTATTHSRNQAMVVEIVPLLVADAQIHVRTSFFGVSALEMQVVA